MTSQVEFKTFLGSYYEEDANYRFDYEAPSYGSHISVEEVGGGDNDIAEGEMIVPVVLNITVDTFHPGFMSEKWFLNQPLDKIKKSSMYDKLVETYGFNDDDYLNGNTEALRDFYGDIRSTMNYRLKSGLKLYLKQYYILTENSVQDLEESGQCLLEARGFDISKIEGLNIPEIFAELDILDTFLEQNKENFGEMYSYSMPKSVHHEIRLIKDK